MPQMGAIARQVVLDSFTAMVIFFGGCSSQRAELKKIPIAILRRWPFETTVHHKNDSTRLQRPQKKVFIRPPQTAPLHTKIGHALNHQTILNRIVHMMELD